MILITKLHHVIWGNNLNINVTQACGITLVEGFRKECLREKEKSRREKYRIFFFFNISLLAVVLFVLKFTIMVELLFRHFTNNSVRIIFLSRKNYETIKNLPLLPSIITFHSYSLFCLFRLDIDISILASDSLNIHEKLINAIDSGRLFIYIQKGFHLYYETLLI